MKHLLKNPSIFNFGTRNQVELISYDSLKENPDYLIIDGYYLRTLYIAGFPLVAYSGWLDDLINFDHNIDISYHLKEINSLSALPKLNRKITELESTKRAMIRDGQIVGSEITDPLESAIELRDKIQRGQEKLFQIAIYINLRAKDLIELNKITKLIETTLSSHLFYSKIARYRQLEGLNSVLPQASNQLNQLRNLDSSSAALTFPFVSSELVSESGILYGINRGKQFFSNS